MNFERAFAPGDLVLTLLASALLPGIVTGLVVLKGKSFKQRIGYGALWAPVSLTVFDALAIYVAWTSDSPEIQAGVTWGTVSFSMLSNLLGGGVGGLIVGAAAHAFVTRNR
jgi:hypothetical protein